MNSSRPRGTSQLDAAGRHFHWKRLLLMVFAVFPAATNHAQTTLKLTVSGNISSSTEGFQYRHVEIATSNGLPAAKDVSVWCHVDTQNTWGRQVRMLEPIPVTLKAGEVLVEKELYLPSGGVPGVVAFSLTAADDPRKRLLESGWADRGIHCQDVLIVDGVGVGESQVTFSRNRRATPTVQNRPNYKELHGKTRKGDSFLISSLHSKIAYLPKRWIGYSSIEQVIINSADFATLSQDAERFDALIQWVTMGGALIVSDCGDDFKCFPTVMRYFKDEESGIVPKMTLYSPDEVLASQRPQLVFTPVPAVRGFRTQSSSGDFVDMSGERFSDNWMEVEGAAGKDGGLEFGEDTDFLLHRFGLGRIVFHSAPLADQPDKQLLNACFLCFASQQHNNPLGSKNAAGDCYEKWHLLNVGIAPIGLFMFVVVSFMTLIGPVGYSYLKIKRKLNYQIWLVPLISALTCLSLLGYAFLSEGVGTKLRPTIFVELDQHRNVAATFARYSIYSALQPPPYQFEDDQFATLENAGVLAAGVYRWSEDGYRLSGGNSSARNVHQVFVAAPVKTNSGIEIKKSNDSQSPNSLSLTNRFNDPVGLLAVKVDGELYFALDLAPSETQVKAASVGDEFTKSDDVKKFLTGRIPANSENYRYGRRGRFYNRRTTGLDEWDIGVKQIDKFLTASRIENHLEDGHYIAILDSMKEVPSVVTGAREMDGSVIVHGKW